MKDFFGRSLSYARISVTDRCNYRCRYCMPEEGVEWIPHDKVLSYEDILCLMGILSDFGIKKVRFTGGEPLVRKGMPQFLREVTTSFPKIQVALTTNGSTLTRDAPLLADIGLASINISLDTLDAENFSLMTRGAALQPVLDGIDSLIPLVSHAKTKIKMNSVLMRGFNDGGMTEQLVSFAFERGLLLRFIEFMPFHSNLWSEGMFMPFSEALARLNEHGSWTEDKSELSQENSLSGPASYYVNAVSGQKIGVISAISRHFCETCNRLRVTSTGEIRPCLFDDGQISIAEALKRRDGEKVRELLHVAAAMKLEHGAAHSEKTRMYAIGG